MQTRPIWVVTRRQAHNVFLFNGSTDRIDWASVTDLTGHALTIFAWMYSDGWAGNSDYILTIHDSGDTAYGIIFFINETNGLASYVQGATDLIRTSYHGSANHHTGAWHPVLMTWTGAIGTATDVKLYVDGGECAYVTTTNGATETNHTGSWSIGGRIYDDACNFDGKLAEVAVRDV